MDPRIYHSYIYNIPIFLCLIPPLELFILIPLHLQDPFFMTDSCVMSFRRLFDFQIVREKLPRTNIGQKTAQSARGFES